MICSSYFVTIPNDLLAPEFEDRAEKLVAVFRVWWPPALQAR